MAYSASAWTMACAMNCLPKEAASINAEIFAAFYKNIPESIKKLLSLSPIDGQEAEMKERAAMLEESKVNLERTKNILEGIYNGNQSV